MCPDEPHLVTYNASGTMVERFYRCLGHSNMIHCLPFHQKVWSTRFVIVLEHLYTFCACARGNNELGNDRQTTLFFFAEPFHFFNRVNIWDTMTIYQLPVAICILLFAFFERGCCNCPVYGCTSFHSFTTPTQYFNSSARPKLLWEFVHEQLRPTGAGCVTNGGRVLCPMVISGQEK